MRSPALSNFNQVLNVGSRGLIMLEDNSCKNHLKSFFEDFRKNEVWAKDCNSIFEKVIEQFRF